jgi:serine/threonine-protein kinase
VAVKVLLAALAEEDPTYAERFEREARAAAALVSSAVVTVYDTGIDEDGGQYIVMEYVPGQSLAEMLGGERPLAIPEAVRIAARVADALRAAHAAGILHRDIKPANVMVADDGTVKLLDFGIARRLDGATVTQVASVVGTAAYMAPERALGRQSDARADIYSLGCLLYAMLTGRPPFTGEIAAAVLHQQVNAEPVPPVRLRAGIPAALDALLLEMLAKAPEARPQSAARVRDRLRALSATAPTAPTIALRPRRRRRSIVAAVLADHRSRALVMALATALVALAAVALLGGGGSSGTQTAGGSHRAPARPVTRTTHRTPTPAPKPPRSPHRQAANSGEPPGHGGKPPGKAKKGDGGDGGGD